MRPKAIIFDLDGTLLDTARDIAESMNEALKEAGFPGHALDEYIRMIGSGLRSLISLALPAIARDDANVDRVLAGMKRIYPGRMTRNTRPYPGIPALLTSLEERNIPGAILSNKPDDMTRQIVSDLLGAFRFEPVIGASPRFPKKPDPASALFIARTLGIKPNDIAYVGDSAIDMENALLASMLPVAVTWGYGRKEELRRYGVAAIVDTADELASFFETIG